MRCIIDTDAGPDDLMALAYLLANDDVEVEAVTTAYGLCPTREAAINVLRILALCGQEHIPVYAGRDCPLHGSVAFPARWRRQASTLPGVSLPETCGNVQDMPAADYLKQRASEGPGPIHILAIGPLSNLAPLGAMSCPMVKEIVVMGGAFDVPGNVSDTNEYRSYTQTAEWNLFVDPAAAAQVLTSDLMLRLIPLDATRYVPLTPAFVDMFAGLEFSPLQRLVCELFALVRPHTNTGNYYAWDPLAAVALLNPAITDTVHFPIRVSPVCGTTYRTAHGLQKSVAVRASRIRWESAFCSAF